MCFSLHFYCRGLIYCLNFGTFLYKHRIVERKRGSCCSHNSLDNQDRISRLVTFNSFLASFMFLFFQLFISALTRIDDQISLPPSDISQHTPKPCQQIWPSCSRERLRALDDAFATCILQQDASSVIHSDSAATTRQAVANSCKAANWNVGCVTGGGGEATIYTHLLTLTHCIAPSFQK